MQTYAFTELLKGIAEGWNSLKEKISNAWQPTKHGDVYIGSGDSEAVYRGMRDNNGVPETGTFARTLGARAEKNIHVDQSGMVYPGTGGMSVAPDPKDLNDIHKPYEFGGIGKDPAWVILTSDLGPDLKYVPDSSTHGTIQPVRTMSYNDYQNALEKHNHIGG